MQLPMKNIIEHSRTKRIVARCIRISEYNVIPYKHTRAIKPVKLIMDEVPMRILNIPNMKAIATNITNDHLYSLFAKLFTKDPLFLAAT